MANELINYQTLVQQQQERLQPKILNTSRPQNNQVQQTLFSVIRDFKDKKKSEGYEELTPNILTKKEGNQTITITINTETGETNTTTETTIEQAQTRTVQKGTKTEYQQITDEIKRYEKALRAKTVTPNAKANAEKQIKKLYEARDNLENTGIASYTTPTTETKKTTTEKLIEKNLPYSTTNIILENIKPKQNIVTSTDLIQSGTKETIKLFNPKEQTTPRTISREETITTEKGNLIQLLPAEVSQASAEKKTEQRFQEYKTLREKENKTGKETIRELQLGGEQIIIEGGKDFISPLIYPVETAKSIYQRAEVVTLKPEVISREAEKVRSDIAFIKERPERFIGSLSYGVVLGGLTSQPKTVTPTYKQGLVQGTSQLFQGVLTPTERASQFITTNPSRFIGNVPYTQPFLRAEYKVLGQSTLEGNVLPFPKERGFLAKAGVSLEFKPVFPENIRTKSPYINVPEEFRPTIAYDPERNTLVTRQAGKQKLPSESNLPFGRPQEPTVEVQPTIAETQTNLFGQKAGTTTRQDIVAGRNTLQELYGKVSDNKPIAPRTVSITETETINTVRPNLKTEVQIKGEPIKPEGIFQTEEITTTKQYADITSPLTKTGVTTTFPALFKTREVTTTKKDLDIKPKQDIKVDQEQIIKPLQPTPTTPKQTPRSTTRTITSQTPIFETETTITPITITSTRSSQLQVPEQVQVPKPLIQTQAQTRQPSVYQPEPNTPETPKSPKTLFKLPTIQKRKEDGYNVRVKRKGLFQSLGVFKTITEAYAKGKERVEQTASASFEIINTNTQQRNVPSTIASNLQLSKRQTGLIIQKRSNRISTIGEKREITSLGLATIKKGKQIFNIKSKRKTRGVFG